MATSVRYGRHDRPLVPAAPFAEATRPLTGEAALAEAERCLFCDEAPCAAACPVHIDVPGFIRQVATDNLAGSARTILAANPLGATCARACPVEVLCEGACVRADIDRPIAIGRLQRHAMDAYAASGRPFFRAGEATGRRVAIVGAGPAGLACAVELRRAGIEVTIFEARERAGGLCDGGIVPWRLNRDVPALEVAEVERAGAEIRRGLAVGRDLAWASLLADHDAVFVGVGLGRNRRFGIGGEDAPGVVDALDVLRRVSAGERETIALGRRVAVIGGGSTALDAAAAAARLGCPEVTVFYRRTETEAPAHPHSIELARSLGVRFEWLAAPVAIRADGAAVAVTFDRMRLGDPDASGRPQPVAIPGAVIQRSFDTVLRAVGDEVAVDDLEGLGLPVTGGRIDGEPGTGRTSNPKVWAGGDAVNGGAEVVDAVAAGREAARSIAAALGVSVRPAEVPAHGPRIEMVTASGARSTVDLSTNVAGVRSPNPFWLASAPPTNTGEMIARAFEAGWGGAVWKTIGDPIVNVSPRLGSVTVGGARMAGINNIELISDRPIETNLAEIREVKRRYPDRAVVASLMYPMERSAWTEITRRVNDTGADGVELNLSCPHGMAERGMGAAVGQVPEFAARCTAWVKEAARVPVFVKLTPNITDITAVARAAVAAGADGLAMINTISSIVGVDLATWTPRPSVAGRSTHGGYAGPAIKPVALNMLAACAADPGVGVPLTGVGGVATWRDAVEFLLLGASSVQVCTAVMHYGHRIIDDLVDGLASYLAERGLTSPAELVGRAVPAMTDWGQLDQGYHVVARIDQASCIHCNLCYRACEDGAHQSIALRRNGRSIVEVDGETCVGCGLCALVCPVDGCVSLVPSDHAPRVHDRPVRA